MKENVPEVISEEVIEINEDWETLGGEMDMSALSRLTDSVSSGEKRKIHYTKDSRTTKWRRKVESSKVDPKSTLFNFGITVVNSDTQEQNEDDEQDAEDRLTHPKRELIKISNCIELLREQVKPEMNQRMEGSSVGSYNQCRLYSVLLYFELCLEGMKMARHLREYLNFSGQATQRMPAQEAS